MTDYENSEKVQARRENVAIYRRLSGLQSIPTDKTYWTLANIQTTEATSEINQLVELGLLTKNQFIGVDNNPSLIEQDRVNHPEATFYAGEWTDVISNNEFNPALVYLDLMSVADSPASADIVYRTMKACPSGAVLIVNVSLNNAYNGHKTTIDSLLENVTDKMSEAEIACWNFDDFEVFEYNGSGSTVMCSIGLKGGGK